MAVSTSPRRAGIPRWLKITIITVLVLANLAAIAFIWAVQTGRTLLAGATTDDEVAGVLDPRAGDRLTFLVVGSDTREGLDDLSNFGNIGGARGDVVMLIRLDAASGTAQMLSIPRDLLVDIPGHGRNRINAAYAFGGPRLMVETVQANLGVEVNHYVEIDFVGFQALVDDVGGIEINFPNPARDPKSGLEVDTAGNQVLDGKQALAYARSRQYQELRDGSWQSVDASDIGRTQRQQDVIRALVRRLKQPSSIAEAGDIASGMSEHMTIDSALAEASVGSLMWDFKGVLTGSIEGATLPTRGDTVEGRSVQVRSEPEASNMLANFEAGRALAAEPLRLQVLNGNGVDGAAGDMSQRLESLGFQVDGVGNADSSTYEETTVIVPEGSVDGEAIVGALGFGVVRQGVVDNGFDAVVIVGADAS